MKFELKKTHKNDIFMGDTIFFRGELKTVCKTDIKHCSFMGRSIFGDVFGRTCGIVDKAIIFKSLPKK